MPAVSVIVPVYKVEQWLAKCVNSILNQSFEDFELILVDDGSPDNSGKLCDDFANASEKVKVIHKQNSGLSGARNAGMDIATGEYFMFIDSDDYIEPQMIETMYAAICKHQAKLAICNFRNVFESEKDRASIPEYMSIPNAVISGEEIFRKHSTGADACYWTIACNKLFHKSIWENLRFAEKKIHEDEYAFNAYILSCPTVVCIHDAFYNYYRRSGSIMTSPTVKSSLDGAQVMLDRAEMFQKKGYPDSAICDALLGARIHLNATYTGKKTKAEKRTFKTLQRRSKALSKALILHNGISVRMKAYLLIKYVAPYLSWRLNAKKS